MNGLQVAFTRSSFRNQKGFWRQLQTPTRSSALNISTSLPSPGTDIDPSSARSPFAYDYLPIQLLSDLQPIKRLKEAGPAALSSAELLSLVLGNGRRGDDLRRAEAMLSANDGIPGLSRLTVKLA